jgi:hypothetical protein
MKTLVRSLSLFLLLFLISARPKGEFLYLESLDHGQFHFPIVQSEKPPVAYKINTHLQLSELELLKGSEKEHLFEVVSNKEGGIYGKKVAIDFKVWQNSSRALSLSLAQSSCGMTCAYWTSYYNFNPQNGDRYFLQDFFSKAHYEKFKEELSERRIAFLQKRSQALKDPHRKQLLAYLEPYLKEDRLRDFYIGEDSLYFDWSNLLHKHDKFLDMNHVVGVAKTEVAALLNDFGQAALLDGRNLKDYQAPSAPQVYQGEIGGQYPFVWLQRKMYDQSWEAIYAYLKYGRGIYLRGNENGSENDFWFDEKLGMAEHGGKVIFRMEAGQMRGYWYDENRSDSLLFVGRR